MPSSAAAMTAGAPGRPGRRADRPGECPGRPRLSCLAPRSPGTWTTLGASPPEYLATTRLAVTAAYPRPRSRRSLALVRSRSVLPGTRWPHSHPRSRPFLVSPSRQVPERRKSTCRPTGRSLKLSLPCSTGCAVLDGLRCAWWAAPCLMGCAVLGGLRRAWWAAPLRRGLAGAAGRGSPAVRA